MRKTVNKKAFTLAEVMIALVMIGIMAALTIPIISSMGPNKKRVMFKKGYATLEQTVRELINSDVYYPVNMVSPTNCTSVTTGTVEDNTYRPDTTECGFAYAGITDTDVPATANTDSKKFYYLLSKKLNTIGTVNYTDDTKKLFTTSDGIDWYAAPSEGNYSIIIDVNGADKPNTTTPSGTVLQDRYTIVVTYQGKLEVTGAKEIEFLTDPTNNKY